MNKFFLFLSLFLFSACSQGGILWITSVRKKPVLTLRQILTESGLSKVRMHQKKSIRPIHQEKTRKKSISKKKTLVKSPKTVTIYPKNIFERLQIAPNAVFSIVRREKDVFFVLKKIEGDLSFLSNLSDIPSGRFVFKSGKQTGGIQLQIYDLSGVLRTNLVYTVAVLPPKPIVVSDRNEPPPQLPVTNKALKPIQSDPLLFYKATLASLRGLSVSKQIREVSKILVKNNIPASDQQKLQQYLIGLYLQNREFSQAEKWIKLLKDKEAGFYFEGLSRFLQSKPQEAVQIFSEGLQLKGEFLPQIVLKLEEVLLKTGFVTPSLLNDLEQKTKEIKEEKDFYIRSKINLIRLYPFSGDLKKSQILIKELENQPLKPKFKNLLLQAKEEISKNFLNYR